MRKLATIIAISLCFAATSAGAIYFDEEKLAKVKAIRVEVEANVDGGCLDSGDALHAEAELILRRSGIKVRRDYPRHTLSIGVTGYAINKYTCAAALRLQLYKFDRLADGSREAVEAAEYKGWLLNGPKGGFLQQLREQVNAQVSKLANEILKARQ
ncbi:MAG: hypothetical protein OSB67_08200 [Alphaproteobacteria bacterium]|jgi:hypothetical protein|nr:hypothetical protein [Alphaproteobacteria bacterium]